jgi:hypothetical protein
MWWLISLKDLLLFSFSLLLLRYIIPFLIVCLYSITYQCVIKNFLLYEVSFFYKFHWVIKHFLKQSKDSLSKRYQLRNIIILFFLIIFFLDFNLINHTLHMSFSLLFYLLKNYNNIKRQNIVSFRYLMLCL